MPLGIKLGDITEENVDVLILKFAGNFRGADLAVASRLGIHDLDIKNGEHRFFNSRGNIGAKEILFVNVGSLHDFNYLKINEFSRNSVNIVATERPKAKSIGITVHGINYGLDELAAIDSLVSGIKQSIPMISSIGDVRIDIIEKQSRRYARILNFISENISNNAEVSDDIFSADVARAISDNGKYRRRLFSAMPFKEKFLDHWEFALQPAAHSNNFIIERLDHEYFIGDVIAELKFRIEHSAAVVAILDEGNPNVFLEVGYAWGIGKPTLLALHADSSPPFDVSGYRLIRYTRLAELRAELENHLKALFQDRCT